MNEHDKKRFASIMTANGEVFDKKITKSLMQTYFKFLSRYSIETVEQAFQKHLLDSDQGMFFPKPANIVKNIEGNAKEQTMVIQDRAESSWVDILGEISRIGSYGTLKLEDRQALSTVRSIGGWKYLCSRTNDQLNWVKKEFMSVYENHERSDIGMLPSKLPGIIECENNKHVGIEGISSLTNLMNEYKVRKTKN